jgi:segregation and condensation protein B
MTPSDDGVRAVEALLFAAAEPLGIDTIRAHVGGIDVRAALARLEQDYAGRGITLVHRGGRWHFQTAPDLAHLLRRDRDEVRRLSRAATETLAIIAYHEPVTRAEIEAIRGVQTAKGTLDVLMEAGWVRPAGRSRRRPVSSRILGFPVGAICRALTTCAPLVCSTPSILHWRKLWRWQRTMRATR